MIFPVEQAHIVHAQKTAYDGDIGTDIGVPVGTPIVAVGDGSIIYAEYGHTPWKTPPDTPYSVKIKLDEPIRRGGKLYPYVFYTHLQRVEPRAKGSRVKVNEIVGWSGIGNRVPHLHISFSQDKAVKYYMGPFAGQNMMWNEWLPAQLEPKPKERKVMVQNGKMHDWPLVPTDKMLRVSNPDDDSHINLRMVFLDEHGTVVQDPDKLIGPGSTWSLPLDNLYGLLKLRSGGTFSSRIE